MFSPGFLSMGRIGADIAVEGGLLEFLPYLRLGHLPTPPSDQSKPPTYLSSPFLFRYLIKIYSYNKKKIFVDSPPKVTE